MYPSASDLILVVVLNSPRDFEIARLLGWYRIPLRSAPRVVAVDYLAFYQTAAFPAQRWQIRYIAPVLGHELTTRAELLREEPEHPRANLEYYKLQIGPLVELAKPVLARNWRRVTFFYTTGEHLLRAETLHDLVVQSEDRRGLWEALRERAAQSQTYQSRTEVDEISPDILAALLGLGDFDRRES